MYFLTQSEKFTLRGILDEKIVETEEIDRIITEELQDENLSELTKDILREALKNVRDVNKECYSISKKFGLE